MANFNPVPPIPSSEITPESVYINRRQFMKLAGLGAAAALLAACKPSITPSTNETPTQEGTSTAKGKTDELGGALSSYEAISTYNNYYEFTTDKEGVYKLAKNFTTRPWTVEVGGLVQKPITISIEDILSRFTSQERIYRLRCVEGWSMVIPWQGFPLAELIKQVEPMASAKYVAFTTVMRPEEMPGLSAPFYPWPYTEGLRLDEAMHDLTILSTGLYGKHLLPQNGAPLRLVVPWKYGFKSIKSIVRIDLVEEQPATLWNAIGPDEYGFYSNVNPERPHPRWSQSTERRIGEFERQDTLKFNGYGEQVASLYTGMDLMVNY
jgi:sulfoxide reductase catalytic subunit YedY